jgi:hypothetical protein
MTTDNALDVVLPLYRKGRYVFSEECLRECYEIQRRYQYDRDREVPLELMRKRVDAEVTGLLQAEEEAQSE